MLIVNWILMSNELYQQLSDHGIIITLLTTVTTNTYDVTPLLSQDFHKLDRETGET